MRFTHANRHCPDHPYATLTRSDDFVLKPVTGNTDLPHDVTRWLERYKLSREREDRTPTGKNERKKKAWKCNMDNHKRIKSRKGLMMDATGEQENVDRKLQSNQRLYCGESQDSQEESQDEDPAENCTVLQMSEDEEVGQPTKLPITPVRRPLDRLQPKKRWLREACLEQQLAKPLRWDPPSTVQPNSVSAQIEIEIPQIRFSTSSNEGSSNTPEPTSDSSLSNYNDALCGKSEMEMLDTISLGSNQNLDISWNLSIKVPPIGHEVTVENCTTDNNTFDNSNSTNQACWDALANDLAPSEPSETLSSSSIPMHNCWDLTNSSEELPAPPNAVPVKDCSNQHVSTSALDRSRENERRPTVLMLAGNCTNPVIKETISNNKASLTQLKNSERSAAKVVVIKQEEHTGDDCIPEDNQKWLGALALMELAKTQQEAAEALGLTGDTGSLVLSVNKQYTDF